MVGAGNKAELAEGRGKCWEEWLKRDRRRKKKADGHDCKAKRLKYMATSLVLTC